MVKKNYSFEKRQKELAKKKKKEAKKLKKLAKKREGASAEEYWPEEGAENAAEQGGALQDRDGQTPQNHTPPAEEA